MNAECLRAVSRSPRTVHAYAEAWRRFVRQRGHDGPTSPGEVAEHLASLCGRGLAYSTIRQAQAAIRSHCLQQGWEDPTSHPDVKSVLAGAGRTRGRRGRKQAPALDEEAWTRIRQVLKPTTNRDRMTLALMAVMRCGLLRQSEVVSLLWQDYEETGEHATVLLRTSKTDPGGEGFVVWLSPYARSLVRELPRKDERIFPLTACSVWRRIKKAAHRSGMGNGFSGHSPRVGMAMDHAAGGASLMDLQAAGRWASPNMPGRYTRRIMAHRNPVARWHEDHEA